MVLDLNRKRTCLTLIILLKNDVNADIMIQVLHNCFWSGPLPIITVLTDFSCVAWQQKYYIWY